MYRLKVCAMMTDSTRRDTHADAAARTAMRRLRSSARKALADAQRTAEEIEDLAGRTRVNGLPFAAGFGLGVLAGALAMAALFRHDRGM